MTGGGAGERYCGDESLLERRAGLFVACAAAAFVALCIGPELWLDVPDLNDGALHLALALRAREALHQGLSPVDFWFSDVGLGYPVFHHYQHLAHLFLVGLGELCGGRVALGALLRIVLFALLVSFPLAVHLALRRLGVRPLLAGCAAACAPLFATQYLYGLGWESYLWGGSGLFTQAFAMVLAPLAFAEGARAVEGTPVHEAAPGDAAPARAGRGLALGAALLAATFLAHLVYGYFVALALAALVVSAGKGDRRGRAARLAVLYVAAFLGASYFLGPAAREGAFANHSVWEPLEKWESLGAPRVFWLLGKGDLLDFGRLPVLTALTGLGLLLAIFRGGARFRLFAGLFVSALLLYCGRATWGMLIDLLPLAREIPLHRLSGAVHLFALPLAGLGLWALGDLALSLLKTAPPLARFGGAAALCLLVLLPALLERHHYARLSLGWKRETQIAFARDAGIGPLLDKLAEPHPGRAYVGMSERPAEHLKIGAVPLTALALVRGIDTLGFLWHSMTFPGDVQVFFNPDDPVQRLAYGVRLLVFERARTPPAGVRLVGEYGRYRLYEDERVALAATVEVPAALRWSKQDAYALANAWRESTLPARGAAPLLLPGREEPPPGVPLLSPPFDGVRAALDALPLLGAQGTVALQPPSRPGLWDLQIDAPAPTAALLRTSFHPGLRATLDGAPAKLLAVAPFFAAVQVPAGAHLLRIEYVARPIWPWLLAGLLALLLAPLAGRRLAALAQRLPDPPELPALVRPLALAAGFALLAGLPLLQHKELAGHDSEQYLTQLSELDRVLHEGQFPPLWAPDLVHGAGAPFFGFYPPLLLATAEVFKLLGADLIVATNLATLLFLALGAVFMFLFVRARWGEGAGLVAAAAYAFAPYVLLDLYVRHAFLEVSSLAWMPLALWGVDRKDPIRTALGSALLMLAHPAIAPFFFPGLALYALARRELWPVASGVLLGIALSAWNFVPAAIERHLLKVNAVIGSGYLHYTNHFAYPDQLVWSPWGFGISVAGRGDGMSFRIGLLHLAALAFALWKVRTREVRALAAMAALAALLATPLSQPLWDHLPLLQAVQFPWRALACTAVAVSALGGVAFAQRPWLGALLFIGLGLRLAQPSGYRPADVRAFAPERIAQSGLQPGTLGIFEPALAQDQPWTPQLGRVLEGRARVSAQWQGARVHVDITAGTPGRALLALNAFPGWEAEEAGKPLATGTLGGRITVPFVPGQHSVVLSFHASPLRRAMGLVSLAALALLLALVGVRLQAARRESRESHRSQRG